jgi:oligopeptidase B
LTPPQAPRRPVQIARHDDVRSDDFFWLREREDPAVLAYLTAENEYTAAVMAHTEPLQAALYAEMLGRIRQTDVSAPLPEGDYWYYTRTEEGKDYPILCRRRSPVPAAVDEEVLLDVNLLAAGHAFCHLGEWRVSPDGRLLAYTLDTEGSEAFVVQVKELAGGTLLPEHIPNAYYGLEWAADSQYLFYTQLGEAHRPDSVWRHRLGADPNGDQRVLHEPDPRFFVGVQKTSSGAFLLFTLESNTTSEVWFAPAARPLAAPQVLMLRRPGHEYAADERAGWFYLRSNQEAANFRVLAAPVENWSAQPGQQSSQMDAAGWREVVAHDPAFLIEQLLTFADYLVLFGRYAGLPALRVLHMAANGPQVLDSHAVALPEAVYTCNLMRNARYDTPLLYFAYSSLKTPNTVYAYDMLARTLHLIKEEEVTGYDPADYVVERLWATAADGAQVPISLVYRQGLVRNGDNPCYLYGYGAYGFSTEPRFQSQRISLLQRGFVLALAHVRGGSELGRAWYEAGKLLHKRNSFTDFIACAELLIAEGYTRPQRLAIGGRSAGGLLMGAVTNLRPDLFAAVLAAVPFVDVINTMLDPSIPLTAMEYEEWGHPDDPQQYAYMRSYSPYDNLIAGRYPRLLLTAGLHDPRVQYWEPAKYAAKLRSLPHGAERNLLLLRTMMSAGHGGPSGRYEYLRETAFEYAFFLDAVG